MRLNRKSMSLTLGLAAACFASGVAARPAWSLEPALGGGKCFSDRTPAQFRGTRSPTFPIFALSVAAEKAFRDPWSVGIRGWVSTDVTNPPGVDPDFDRTVGRIVPYVKRTLYERGIVDLTGMLGLGFENLHLKYSYGSVDPDLETEKPPPVENHNSPVLAVGLSQRVFFRFLGFTVNETAMASFHTVSYHFDFGIPIGWRKKPQ
jgi:hypothetical protein